MWAPKLQRIGVVSLVGVCLWNFIFIVPAFPQFVKSKGDGSATAIGGGFPINTEQKVKVINGPDMPVPVEGNLNISGNVDANIINDPLNVKVTNDQTMPASVNVENEPNVNVINTVDTDTVITNDETNPVIVQGVPNFKGIPFQAGTGFAAGSATTENSLTTFTVPSDKQAVIHYVSLVAGESGTAGKQYGVTITTMVDGTARTHYFDPLPPTVNLPITLFGGTVNNTTSMGTLVRLFADPGTNVTIQIRRVTTGQSWRGEYGISGRLEDQ